MIELNSPTETVMELVQSPAGSSIDGEIKKEISSSGERTQMKKELGLLEGCAIILGIIFGSGKKSKSKKRNNLSA
jgi:hypothetical protein